ncbi:membrane protein [Kitasatospora indigofera]|uniref:Membrane protein n=1 Tax=Kitasatospora indigofera TaxID=67307 RepID=A0A919FQ14_9ACTN|nr:membrane protein [Kitasatospora indigofera]
MDTRTPRFPGQGGTAGIDSGPGLNTVKVPSDPARLSSTQASFRLRLGAPVAPLIDVPGDLPAYGAAFGDPYASQGFIRRPLVTPQVVVDTAEVPLLAGAAVGAPRRKGRVTAVTWTGQAAPGDMAATRLLEAVRLSTVPAPAGARGPGARADDDTQLLPPYGGSSTVPRQPGSPAGPGTTGTPRPWTPAGELPEVSATAAGDSRHAWYPGRRVDLGLVLLPLRVLLGSLSVYAGFSKLCNPVYFDGGDRGSMMRWLASLHPWRVAEPLLDFAMAHPVGAGLGVAFTEIVVGVLSILGLWQRFAAGAAMVLSAALLFTVSWRSVPVYDTPDLIFLAAWSPLLIAGAPFGSLDGRLALEAWRRYGAGAPGALRRRVLRRGAVITSLVVGLTLLLGSMLGAAVRTGGRPAPGPATPSSDYGTPLWPGTASTAPSPAATPTGKPSPTASHPPTPTATPSASAPASPKASQSAKPRSGKTDAAPSAGTPNAPAAGTSSSGRTAAPGGTAPRPSQSSAGSGLLGGVLGSAPLTELPALGAQQGGRAQPGTVVST